MPNPLNPTLYGRLGELFGTVKIANDGMEMASTATVEYVTGAHRLDIRSSGEYYRVCCPFCNDARYRLWVNYRYGQRDAWGRTARYLSWCYNDKACMSKPECVSRLWEMIGDVFLLSAKVRRGTADTGETKIISMPGPCTFLRDLEHGHKAREYLIGRHFDPDKLSDLYDLAYCHDSRYFLARDRLIIPVNDRGNLVGWQARYIGELDWKHKRPDTPIKYFTCPGMPRRSLLYNWDNCREWETAVIVEGPSDVWRFGVMSCCTFGASMPDMQRRKVAARFGHHSVVLLWDADTEKLDYLKDLVAYFHEAMPKRFAVVTLPEGTDPAMLDRSFLRDYVCGEAARQGVEVVYRKRVACH